MTQPDPQGARAALIAFEGPDNAVDLARINALIDAIEAEAIAAETARADALEGAAELGDAWAEAEAAIGPQFKDLTLRQQYDGRYLAGSAVRQGHGGISGPTPAAALRALAALLRDPEAVK